MNLLTPYGYKDIADVNIGDELVAYDIADGHRFNNVLEKKQWFSPDLFEDEVDEDGNVVKTKQEVFEEIHGELKAYVINDTWTLYKHQSVWANLNVVHAQDLTIGDVIYDDDDKDITITSIEEIDVDGWWRLTVSGDHSYIADNLTLHNASRYWSGNRTSVSPNWNYTTGGTNWGSASATADNASVPTSADDVIFDGQGTNGNTNSTISATITILSLNITADYTATMTHNALLEVGGNITLGANYTIAGAASIYAVGDCTLTSNGTTWPNSFGIRFSFTVTLVGDFITYGGFDRTGNSGTKVINKTSNEIYQFNGFVAVFTTNYNLSGTATLIISGGNIESAATTSGYVSSDVILNGNVKFGSLFNYRVGTMTYLSGDVKASTCDFSISSSCTLLNFDKIFFKAVTIRNANNQVITLNRFFAGTPSQICQVSQVSGQYTIQFQDRFEKIGRNVAVSGATIANRGQLLLTTNPRFNTNRSTNIGVRYGNTMPNGISKGDAPSKDMAFGTMGLAADPCFQRQG